MRILITGATGFVGGHLAEHLLRDAHHELHGLCRNGKWPRELANLKDDVLLHSVDLQSTSSIEQLLADVRPDWIFHLAGYANAGKSFKEPELTWVGNWRATFKLYEAVSRSGLRPRILYASSGLVYGQPIDERPCREVDVLQPASPYACSKAAADLLSFQATCHPGLDVVRVRCFNQIGPRQSPEYSTASFARQIAAIEQGRQHPVLDTGDLGGRRDLTDVRDMVRAFVALMKHGRAGEAYNAGSGEAPTMRFVLDRLLSLTRVQIAIRERVDPERKSDPSVSRADVSKLRAATGWRPQYSLDESLADLLNYWRQVESDSLTP
jgi:GDP-4-dehydro-6-deoxy-D-mannose reductase